VSKKIRDRIAAIWTRLISSLVKVGRYAHDEQIELFFVAGVSCLSAGVMIEFGRPFGLIALGFLLLLPVANKLR